jgi:hypothetical protein
MREGLLVQLPLPLILACDAPDADTDSECAERISKVSATAGKVVPAHVKCPAAESDHDDAAYLIHLFCPLQKSMRRFYLNQQSIGS